MFRTYLNIDNCCLVIHFGRKITISLGTKKIDFVNRNDPELKLYLWLYKKKNYVGIINLTNILSLKKKIWRFLNNQMKAFRHIYKHLDANFKILFKCWIKIDKERIGWNSRLHGKYFLTKKLEEQNLPRNFLVER